MRNHYIGFGRREKAQTNGQHADTQIGRRDDAGKERYTMFSNTYEIASRRLRALLAALLAFTALAAGAGTHAPAPAAAYTREACYTIESRLNGYMLQVGTHTFTESDGVQRSEPDPWLDARLVVGPKVTMPTTPGGVYVRGGTYLPRVWVRYDGYLVSKLNGFALDLLGDATAPSIPVVINPVSHEWHYRTPEKFDIDADGYIADRATGLVLDIANGSTEPGAKVIAWTRKGLASAANQRWNLVRVPDDVCYPPPSDPAQPLTHFAGTGGPGATQGVPVVHLHKVGTAMTSHMTWHPDTFMLSTYVQFTGMTTNGIYIKHHETVRNMNRVRRNLPPPSYNTVEDNWATNWVVGEILHKMPEEMYVLLTAKGGYAIEARIFPNIYDPDGGDL